MFGFKKKQLPEDAKYVMDIIHKYAEKDTAKKLISPISDEYFIIDEENQIFICIEDDKVTISNHTFLYKKFFNLSVTTEFKKAVRESIEREMQELKNRFLKTKLNYFKRFLKWLKTKKFLRLSNPILKTRLPVVK